MARMSKAEKALEKAADDAFRKFGNNIQFDIFDLGKIHDAGVEAGRKGQSVEEAVKAAIAQYRKN